MRPLFTLSPLDHGAFVALGLLVYVLVTRIGGQRRHPSAALAWVIAIATFPYVALPLFLLFGTRKFARPLRRSPVAALPPDDGGGRPSAAIALPDRPPRWATKLLAGLDVAPPRANADAAFHADGEQSLRALLALVGGARRRIDCCTYLLGDDATGRRIAAALARAARRGVAVRLLIDAFGSMRTSRVERRVLDRAGVQVRRFMPVLHNPLHGRTNLRNHRKLVAVDGRWLWSGGRNLAGEYFDGLAGAAPWVDLSFVVEGPIAADAHTLFTRDWRIAGGRRTKATLPPPLPAFPADVALPVMAQLVPSGPDRVDDTVHALLLAAAWQAERRLLAVTPYFVPDEALIDAWCMACRRGVRVVLVVPRRSNHRLADCARERALRALVHAGGSVLLADEMVHGKAVVVDDRLALCGSVNLDGRSLFLNYELTTAFYGAAEIDWLAGWIERLGDRSTAYAARTPPWWRDVVEGVVRVVGFQL